MQPCSDLPAHAVAAAKPMLLMSGSSLADPYACVDCAGHLHAGGHRQPQELACTPQGNSPQILLLQLPTRCSPATPFLMAPTAKDMCVLVGMDNPCT